jgi:hypothetical protein
MQQFIYKRLAALTRLGQGSARRQDRRVRPQLEALEDRLVPSATAPRPVVAHAAHPQTAPVQVHSGTPTASTGDVWAEAVHGYKWRRRWPVVALASDGSTRDMRTPLVAQHGAAAQAATANHLAVGGSDQMLVFTATDGHLDVQPPEGPLPTEQLAAIG